MPMNNKKNNIKVNIDPKYRGIICIIIAAFGFAFMNLFVKLSGDLPAIEKGFFRNLVAVFVALFIMIKNKIPFTTGEGGLKYLILRSVSGTLGIFTNFYAISMINISDASMLNKLSPFFAILFSAIMIKEKPKLYQLLCVVVAFIGAIFILKPGADSVTFIPALIGISGAAFAGFAYTNVRIASMHKVLLLAILVPKFGAIYDCELRANDTFTIAVFIACGIVCFSRTNIYYKSLFIFTCQRDIGIRLYTDNIRRHSGNDIPR